MINVSAREFRKNLAKYIKEAPVGILNRKKLVAVLFPPSKVALENEVKIEEKKTMLCPRHGDPLLGTTYACGCLPNE